MQPIQHPQQQQQQSAPPQQQQRAMPPAAQHHQHYAGSNPGQLHPHQQLPNVRGMQQQDHHQQTPPHQMHHPQNHSASVHALHELEISSGGGNHPQQHAHQQHISLPMVQHGGHSQQQMLVHHQPQGVAPHPGLRIEQSSSLQHMHPAPPAPPQQQRIFIQQAAMPQVLPPQQQQEAPVHPPHPIPHHPHLYIGSQRFAATFLSEMEMQTNVSPKQKYRDLKKKFKYLVYENEYYQEELRNLQRKLLKLSRDKNFLLDRLGQYEQLSDSSDDSDASTKTLEDRGISKQKKKTKQAPNRKRTAPNSSAPNSVSTSQTHSKRVASKTTPAKQKGSEPKITVHQVADLSQKEETVPNVSENMKQDLMISPNSPFPADVMNNEESIAKIFKMEPKDSSANSSNSVESSYVSQ